MGAVRDNQLGGLRLTDGRVFRGRKKQNIRVKLRAAKREQWVVGRRHG